MPADFTVDDDSGQERLVDQLRTLILSRNLSPGERLVQNDLAEQLGVSRTPVREALHQLASEGLVTILPNKGATVAKLELSDLEDIYSIRIALEGYGARLAAQQMDEHDLKELRAIVSEMKQVFALGDRWHLLEINRSFYQVLYSIAGRARLYDLIMRYMDLADMYRRMAFTIEHHYAATIADHERLLEALVQHDLETVERVAREQLERTASDLMAFLEEAA